MQIGEKIKRIRTTFNLTQEELGQDLHLTRQTISNWEKGKSYPSIQDIVTISDRYHVSLDELLKEDQEMLAHFESVDRQSVRQQYLYALAYCISIVCLAIGLLSRHGCHFAEPSDNRGGNYSIGISYHALFNGTKAGGDLSK